MHRPFKVVIVDDSLTMRRWLNSVIAKDPRLNIVGMAGNAQEAREVIKATQPDVLTLDIEMPGINGLEFLAHLMRLHPMPVVMLASSVQNGSLYAQKALEIGAVACVAKPQVSTFSSMAALCESIFNAASGAPIPPVERKEWINQVLLVGASTGGVAAIETMLASLKGADIPPIVIAQHMPHKFLSSFAKRLDTLEAYDVGISVDGMRLEPGCVRLAPSQGHQTCVAWRSGAWHIQEVAQHTDQTYCPSVDVLFHSAVPWAQQVGAMILTGLGSDGARGMLALRQNGARTIGQSQETCAVDGMPGAARALNASEDDAPIHKIAATLLSRMRGGFEHARMR